jgi:hypothetical protein
MRLQNCKYVVASGTTGRFAGCDLLAHPEMNDLYCLWNCGFYSNEFQVFSSLLTLLRHGIIPDRIDYSLGYRHFKKDPNQDIYPNFHEIDCTKDLPLYMLIVELPDSNRCQFDIYNFEIYNKVRDRFFNPSSVDTPREKNYLTRQSTISTFEKTISVLYRGTDKENRIKTCSS